MPGFIPYGAYWSTPFVRWQSAFAHLNSIEFAAHVTKKAMAERGIAPDQIDHCAYGLTVIQPGAFYATPWFTAMIGAEGLPGPTMNQACATGPRLLSAVLGEIALGNAGTALIASGDRTSNGAHVYYPAPSGPGGTGQSEDWVLGSFNHDPWAKGAMVDTAENVARREGITTAEQHEVVLHRHAQYHDALADGRAFQRRYMQASFDVPDARFRKTVASIEGDQGVHPVDPEKMAALAPVREGGSVTFAGQTHPADGNAGMIVTDSAGRAAEIAGSGPSIEVLAVAQAREDKGFMPAAPILATRRVLERAGLSMSDVTTIKSHNPFAVNDIAFARAFGLDWRTMNNYGSSLVWGHPQGPTGLRGMIEMIEELEIRGGGIGLFQGCAAGDSAMAVLMRVS
ncbi:thiolase family protein [Maritimibacter sp. HL-12]|uniref:thiolase family protein n=1 Tax=Maritimibacter sp. HL-12 TaxID=1162418 RepID=UPI000A0F298C|nr:thiolase family protein [Maritimibacter sp. HL-12]SMH36246.1 Acetyl-CoA acetyltransferase [Maritimibacter sp. HL-12]